MIEAHSPLRCARRVLGPGACPILLLALALLLVGCGGGGPDVRGPEARALFADYSATWVLDTLASDPAPDMDDLVGRPGTGGSPFGGAAPGAGGRPGKGVTPPGGAGGRGGGGMVGRGGGGMPGRGGGGLPGRGGLRGPNPDAMEARRYLMEAARQRPSRITLELDDSIFSATVPPTGVLALPVDGDEIELPGGSWPTKAKVEWDDLQPRLHRSFGGAGTVVDHLQVVEGVRLILTRTVKIDRMPDLKIDLAYDRWN